MKKEQRLVFIALTEEIDCPLCTFCKNAEHESEGCCEGTTYCEHPIERLSEQREDGLEPGQDCWGFYPDLSVTLLADIVGAILSQHYDEWGVVTYSKTAVTLYGRTGDKTGKVRIGHHGKPEEEKLAV